LIRLTALTYFTLARRHSYASTIHYSTQTPTNWMMIHFAQFIIVPSRNLGRVLLCYD